MFFPIFTCLLSGFSRVLSLRPHGLQPARLLCPWDSPGKNTGMGSHALLQGVFLTQGSNPRLFCLRHWQVSSLPLSHLGSPLCSHQNSRSRPQSACPVSKQAPTPRGHLRRSPQGHSIPLLLGLKSWRLLILLSESELLPRGSLAPHPQSLLITPAAHLSTAVIPVAQFLTPS